MSSGTTNPNSNALAELQRIRQTLRTIETRKINPASTNKNELVARHHELVEMLWKPHTARRLDPAKYFPIEIVDLIFSFAVYHAGELELEGPWHERMLAIPSSEIIVGYRDAPLTLASVSRDWCQIATNHPPLWSTIFIDQFEDDFLERIHLFLDRSGKELLDIILLDHATPTLHLKDFLTRHANRFKTLVGLSAPSDIYDLSARIEPLESPASFTKWSVYTSRRRKVSTIPIPKCLRRIQLRRLHFDSRSLIQFTRFHNLESLSISITLEPENTTWDDTQLRFEQLRHFRLNVSNANWLERFNSESPWIEWLECPVLVDLDLVYKLNQHTPNQKYARLEACLLRFTSLQNLSVRMDSADGPLVFEGSEFQNMRPSTFNGRLESVQLQFGQWGARNAWADAVTERFFTVFTPNTHLAWSSPQFPSPTVFASLKTIHIHGPITGDLSALVAPRTTQMEFPFLEELRLYLEFQAPRWLGLLYAPCLTSLHITCFIPSDLRHISNSTISDICLDLRRSSYHGWTGEDEGDNGNLQEIYLPSADKMQLDLPIGALFHLNVHSSQIQAVTLSIFWNKDTLCPPHWTEDYVSEMLGTITDLNITNTNARSKYGFPDLSQKLLLFLKPLVYVKHLTLPWDNLGSTPCVDQLAQHLLDPTFLPKLETLSISEYPSWPYFLQYIQQRQTGFLGGHFQTALKEITIRRGVHRALLEHLREALAGKYIGLLNMPPHREGSKEWPAHPFDFYHIDTSGLLCCYACHKGGLEIGCAISPSGSASTMQSCSRHLDEFGYWESNTVFAP